MRIEPLLIPDRYFGEPIPIAPDLNQVVDKVDELVAAVNAGLATSNAIVGGPKYVRYTSSQYYNVPADALTLDRLDPASILPGNLATVINSSATPLSATEPSRQYVATIVAAGTAGALQVPAYTGASTTVPISWQPISSADSFTPLLEKELPAGKTSFAGLDLRPLLIAIIGGLGSANTVVVSTPAPPATTPAPIVTGFLPGTAAISASVTVTGTGFTKATAVLFNGTAASFQVLNATTIIAVVPPGATTGPVSVATLAGTGTSAADFVITGTVVVTPPPTTTYTATQQGYQATAQDYADKCGNPAPSGYQGPSRTNSTATSTVNQADANALALALATAAAKDAIVCQVVNIAYEWTLTGPKTRDTTGIAFTTDGAAHTLNYDRIYNGDSTAKRMDLFLSGTQLAAIDFPAAYLGKPFIFKANGISYRLTFSDSTLTL